MMWWRLQGWPQAQERAKAFRRPSSWDLLSPELPSLPPCLLRQEGVPGSHLNEPRASGPGHHG